MVALGGHFFNLIICVSIMFMDTYFIILIGLLGAALGSFAAAQVWRLRADQLDADKQSGELVDQAEFKKLKPLLGKTFKSDRSRCLSCHHELRWYDLLPIVSWVTLAGRCRYCKAPIGIADFALELAMAGLFIAGVIFWSGSISEPLEAIKLVLWLVSLVALAVNFMYDARWSLLVSGLNWLLIICGVLYAGIVLWQSPDVLSTLGSIIGSVFILGGLYGALWVFSKGKLVGEGDIYLGIGLGLFLADWRLGFIALFAGNLIGTLAVMPQLISKKLKRGSHVPLGPLLIVGFLIAWFWGVMIVDWYQELIFLS